MSDLHKQLYDLDAYLFEQMNPPQQTQIVNFCSDWSRRNNASYYNSLRGLYWSVIRSMEILGMIEEVDHDQG